MGNDNLYGYIYCSPMLPHNPPMLSSTILYRLRCKILSCAEPESARTDEMDVLRFFSCAMLNAINTLHSTSASCQKIHVESSEGECEGSAYVL
jgi:hypothetical protein